jgi:hypothetical protein
MSWDVLLMRLPEGTASLEEIPDDFQPMPLGPRGQVLDALRAAEPAVDLTDSACGRLAGPTWSMELHIGSEDTVDTIMLCIRGTGDDVLAHVIGMATSLGCGVFSGSDGEVVTEADTESWHASQRFTEHVLGWTV